jgi:hypothetical protein
MQRNQRWNTIKQAKIQIKRAESADRQASHCSFQPETNTVAAHHLEIDGDFL